MAGDLCEGTFADDMGVISREHENVREMLYGLVECVLYRNGQGVVEQASMALDYLRRTGLIEEGPQGMEDRYEPEL